MPQLNAAQTWAVLQGVQTLFLVLLLLLFYLRMRRDPFLLLWSFAWMAHALWLGAAFLGRSPGSAGELAQALVFVGVLAGFLQACLLVLGARMLPRHGKPRKVRAWPWLALTAVLSVAVFAISQSVSVESAYPARRGPQWVVLGLVYIYCAVEFYRWWKSSASHGARLTAFACAVYGASNLLSAALLIWHWQVPSIPFPWFASLADSVCLAAIALGVVMLLLDEHRRSENARLESEARFGGVAESLAEGVVITSPEDRILYANRAFLQLIRYARKDVISQPAYRLLHAPSQWEMLWQKNRERLEGRSERYEIEMRRKDGSTFTAEVSAAPYRDSAGQVLGILNVVSDISERKGSERLQGALYRIAEAAQSPGSLDDLFHSVHMIVQDVMPASNFYIALYDEKEDLISFPYFVDEEDSPEPPRKPRRGNTEHVLRTGRSLLSTQAVHDEMTRRGEVELIGPMSPIWLGVPLRAGEKTIGVMAVQHYQNPTAYGEREQRMLEFVSSQVAKAIAAKQAEEALRQSEEKFARAFRSSPDAMVLSRVKDGVFLEVNEGFLQLSGFTREEVIGKSSLELNMWARPEAREEITRALQEHGRARNIEAEFRDKDGNLHIGLVSAELMDFGGEPCMLVVTRDITRRKEMEEAIRRSEEKFSKAFHASPDAMVISSMAESRFLEVNQSFLKLTGHSREDVVGRTSNDLRLWLDPEHRVRISHAVRDKGVLRNEEFQLRTKSGEVLICLLSVDLVQLGGQSCFLNVIRDITDRKQMEEALRYSEERYRELFENANDIVYTHDLAGNFTSLNRTGERLTGYTAEEARRLNLAQILSAEQLGFVRDMVRQKLEGKGPTTYELEIKRKGGGLLTLEVSTRLIHHEGEPIGVQGIARDITERKRAERERLRFLRIQTALGQAGRVLLSTLDPDKLLEKILEVALASLPSASKGAFLSWDRAAEALHVRLTRGYGDPRVGQARFIRTGYSYWAAVSRQPLRVEDAWTNEFRFESDVPEIQNVRSAVAAPLISRDRLLGVISLDSDSPNSFDEEDKELLLALAGLAALAMENARLYEQVEESRENYRIVSDLVSDWAYSLRVEPDGRLVNEWVTEAFTRSTGYAPADLDALGGWKALAHPEDRPEQEQRYAKLLRGESDVTELRILAKNGDVRWIRDYARPEWDAARQHIVRIYGAAQDTTERRTLEDQLRQAQKMEAVGRLAGGVAHDFNNLLMVIRGYTELLTEQLPPDSPLRRSTSQIEKASDRAAALTQQLLAFSRKQVLTLQTLNLNHVLAGVDKMLGRVIGEDIELVTRPAEQLGYVKADPGQIEQMILNLAVNSRDAMPNGGQLILETADTVIDEAFIRMNRGAVPGRYVLLSVTDTGLGMDAATQARVFEPFFTTKEKGKGTGLGLATVYGIVKQSNGYIAVESEPGKGTCFRIYFPQVDPPAEAPADPHARPAANRGQETVLVVEDQDDVRALALEFLRGQGYMVLEACNGAEALQVARHFAGRIDLLMTDVVMPGISGRELAQKLTEARPDTRVLYVSGYTEEAIGQHGVLEKGTEFLAKPFSRDALAHKLREILDNGSPSAS